LPGLQLSKVMSAMTHTMSETIFNVSVHLVPIDSGQSVQSGSIPQLVSG